MSSSSSSSSVHSKLFDIIDEEIKIRGTMYDTEVQMRQKRNMNTPKKRRKLEKRVQDAGREAGNEGGGRTSTILRPSIRSMVVVVLVVMTEYRTWSSTIGCSRTKF